MKACLALAATLLAGCATVPARDTTALPPGAHYVAMGSSFAAGAGIGPTKAGTPQRCSRTALNYASLLAERHQLDLDDQSCGGATTANLLTAWDELPPQIDAIGPTTRLVTVTVGGNDLNYMGLLFSASCNPAEGMVYRGERQACPQRIHLPDSAAFAGTQAQLSLIAQTVKQRAPNATLIFVQYVWLVPETPCSDIPLDRTAIAEARELAKRLAEITERAALENGALVLPVDRLSTKHTACDAEPWSRGFGPATAGLQGAPWHPTIRGHAAIAEALTDLLQKEGLLQDRLGRKR